MHSVNKSSKRIFSCILVLSLMLNILLTSGIFPVTVFAEEAPESTGIQTFYVDGVSREGADGLTPENAFQYVSQAYAQIPANNVKTTIVICKQLSLRNDPGLLWYGGDSNVGSTAAAACVWKKDEMNYMHPGEVVFTATVTDKIQFPSTFLLTGNTTFENIDSFDITSLYANYFNLHLGQGVRKDLKFATNVYLGTYADGWTLLNKQVSVNNVKFTMESNTTIYNLYGGGYSSQGSHKNNTTPYSFEMNIAGGTVDKLYIASSGYSENSSTVATPVSGATINISGNAVVNALNKTINYGTIAEGATVNAVLDLQDGQEVTMTVGEGLELGIIDSDNTAKDGSTADKAKLNITGTISAVAQDPNTQMRYLAVPNDDGTYSAHPFNLSIVQYGLNTMNGGAISLRVVMMANDEVAGRIDDYGLYSESEAYPDGRTQLLVNENEDNLPFTGNYVNVCIDLKDSLTTDNLSKTVTYSACMVIDEKPYYSTTTIDITPGVVLEQIAAGIQGGSIVLNADQIASIKGLMGGNSTIAGIFANCDCLKEA